MINSLCFRLQVVLFWVFISLGAQAEIFEKWTILGEGGKAHISAAISVDRSLLGTTLDLTLQPKARNSDIVDLLTSYYAYAIRNDVAALKTLFFKLDKSQQQISKELEMNPEKYGAFQKIKSVQLDRLYKWGDYLIVEVLLDLGDSKMRWQDTVICQSICYLSNIFAQPDESTDLFSSALFSYRSSVKRGEVLEQINKKQLKSFGISIRPTFYSPNTDHPLLISFDVAKQSKELLVAEKNKKITRDKSSVGDFLARFLQKVWVMDEDYFYPSDDPKVALSRIEEGFSSFWLDFNVRKPVTLYRYDFADDIQIAPGLYHILSFLQTVNTWSKVYFLGSFSQSGDIYAILKIEVEGKNQIQVLPINKDGKNLKFVNKPKNRIAKEFIYSKYSAEFLYKEMFKSSVSVK